MDDLFNTYNRRWYDGISNMTMALHLSRQFPREIQMIIARNLNDAIDDYRKLKRNDKYAVSLGQQRTLGLHKASNRQRWYDPYADLHRAFNFMTTVPEPFLSEFAGRILAVGRYIEQQQEYFKFADEYLLNDTIESILRKDSINLEESGGSIKLVAGTTTPTAKQKQHPRNVLPIRSVPHGRSRPR